jgi:hypothetical protein
MALSEPSKLKVPGMDDEALDIINPLTALPEKI